MIKEKIKELRDRLKEVRDVRQQADLINNLAWSLNRSAPEKSLELAMEARSLAESCLYKRGMASALMTIGICNTWLSKTLEGIKKSLEALQIFQEIKESAGEIQVLYNLGASFFYMADYDRALQYFLNSKNLSEETGNKKGEADALNGLGTVYYTLDENAKAISTLNESLELCDKIKNNDIKAKVLDGLGNSHNKLGEYEKGMDRYYDCLKISTEIGNKHTQTFALNGIGFSFLKLEEFEKTNQFCSDSLKISQEIGFKVGEITAHRLLGEANIQIDSQQAASFLKEAVKIADSIKNSEMQYQAHESFSKYYEFNEDYKNFIKHFKKFQEHKEITFKHRVEQRTKSLELQHKMDSVEQEKEIFRLKNIELKQKTEELEQLYRDAQILSELGQEITSNIELEEVLSSIYSKVNNLMDASSFYIGIYNPELEQIEFHLGMSDGERLPQVNFSMEEKNRFTVWAVKNNKEVFMNDKTESKKYLSLEGGTLQDETFNSLIIIPLSIEEKVIGVIGIHSKNKNAYTEYQLLMLRAFASSIAIAIDNAKAYHNLNLLHGELEVKNKNITDSIKYAKHIQRAILPKTEDIKKSLPEFFVYYEPRDIVSGDFYWYAEQGNELYLAAADCTGHGVPGALMSMVGYNGLNQALIEKNHKDPASILEHLDNHVYTTMLQKYEGSVVKDGMDVGLCQINLQKMELQYAGAYLPLLLIRGGEIIEFEAEKYSIGTHSEGETRTFQNQTVTLESGDVFYLFSDGFADQFGGPNKKKFRKQNLRELLKTIHHLPMEEQKKKITLTFENWKGELDQLDDVCLMGVKITE